MMTFTQVMASRSIDISVIQTYISVERQSGRPRPLSKPLKDMRTTGITYTAIAFSIILATSALRTVFAQQPVFDLIIHTDRLPQDEQVYLKNFDEDLKAVLSGFNWVEDAYNYEMSMRIEIFFEDYALLGNYHKYGAGVMVALKSGLQIREKRWDFRIDRNFNLTIDSPYDPCTGLLQFYILLCLGFETDKYGVLKGQPYYSRAREVADKARFEIQFFDGWTQRRELADDFTLNETYKNMRTAYFYVNAGFYYIGRNEEELARQYLTKGIEIAMQQSPKYLELRRDGHIIRFIDVQRLVEALDALGEFDLIDKLAEWDTENVELYK